MTRSMSFGRPWTIVLAVFGSSRRIAESVETVVGPSNARRPVTIS